MESCTQGAQEQGVCCSQQSWNGRKEPSKSWPDIRQKARRFRVCPAGFQLCIGPVFPQYAPSPFWMARYILCHCMLELYNLLSDFEFTGSNNLNTALSFKTEFGLLNCVVTEKL